MENASKALLMAASVLIGTIILSLAVYLYISFTGSANKMGKQMEEGQLQQFNNKFTSYVDKKNLTIYDVVTVANMAKDNNAYYDLNAKTENNFYIQVSCDNVNIESKTEQELEKMLEDNNGIKYTCTVEYSPNTGRVNIIEFKKVS